MCTNRGLGRRQGAFGIRKEHALKIKQKKVEKVRIIKQ